MFAGVLAVVAPAALAVQPVVHYDFDHPDDKDAAREVDQGSSGTRLWLVNGGAAMRVADPAYPGAGMALQTRQVNPGQEGNDDWKAGVFDENGVETLHAFSAAEGITLMGWVKPMGPHPKPNTTTPDPEDHFGAVGLFGLLSGTSEGHLVRALLEVIQVDGTLRLVALGRRADEGTSMIVAAEGDWENLLPTGQWTHIAATFDYDGGEMTLFRNGQPLAAAPTVAGDPWAVEGGPEPDRTSASDPNGIKIGGSYPQNTVERNPFDGRFDDLVFFDRALAPGEVLGQFRRFQPARD